MERLKELSVNELRKLRLEVEKELVRRVERPSSPEKSHLSIDICLPIFDIYGYDRETAMCFLKGLERYAYDTMMAKKDNLKVEEALENLWKWISEEDQKRLKDYEFEYDNGHNYVSFGLSFEQIEAFIQGDTDYVVLEFNAIPIKKGETDGND